MPEDVYEGWHFLPADRRLTHGDGRRVELGVPIEVTPPARVSIGGLHAAENLAMALVHARGPIACRVRLDGQVDRLFELTSATRRTVLAWADVSAALVEFGLRCAEDVIDRHPDPDAAREWIALRRRWPVFGEGGPPGELLAAGEMARAAWGGQLLRDYAGIRAAEAAYEAVAGRFPWRVAAAAVDCASLAVGLLPYSQERRDYFARARERLEGMITPLLVSA